MLRRTLLTYDLHIRLMMSDKTSAVVNQDTVGAIAVILVIEKE